MVDNLFHLLITLKGSKAWKSGQSMFPVNRFLDYTTDSIASRFQGFTPSIIEELKSYPCLCGYIDGDELFVARITRIVFSSKHIRLYTETDPNIPPISSDHFRKHLKKFGVDELELKRFHWAIKEGGLLQKLHEAQLLPKTTSLSFSLPKPSTDVTKDDVNPAINSVTDYIQTVMKLKKSSKWECFYRGQPDDTYLLKPGIFRTDRKTGAPLYLKNEHEMFREILISNSFDFREDSSTLDRLVRMQHHGLPTRLLDITINPLIALFFAVWSDYKDKKNVQGEVVLIFPAPHKIKYFDSDTASCIANLALMSVEERDQIEFELKADPTSGYIPGADSEADLKKFNSQNQVARLLHYIGSEKPFFKPRIKSDDLRSIICVKSKRSNDRISSQSGAFLLFGHEALLNEAGEEGFNVRRIKVTDKKKLLHELELLNITESTVFPHIVNAANDIARKYNSNSEF